MDATHATTGPSTTTSPSTTASATTAGHPFPHRADNPFSSKTPAPVAQQSPPPPDISTSTSGTGRLDASAGAVDTSGSGGADTTAPADNSRSTVILAPARLALNSSSLSSTGATGAVSSHTMQNNYFSSNISAGSAGGTTGAAASGVTSGAVGLIAESRLSTTVTTTTMTTTTSSGTTGGTGMLLSTGSTGSTTAAKSLLRPSVLRFADSSTNNSQNAPKETKKFAFVSLSREDIPRPATTLLPADSIIRCGADTTSPFNGEEAPHTSLSTITTTGGNANAVNTSTGSATTANPLVTSSSSSEAAASGGVSFTAAMAPGGSVSTGAGSSVDSCDDSNSQSAFVFGQNLAERAVFVQNSAQKHGADPRDETTGAVKRVKTAADGVAAPGDDLNGDVDGATGAASTSSATDGVLDLSSSGGAGSSEPSESDRNSAENKRKYEVKVITGEEDEQHVLSMHCRLYAWETDTWRERGRGCLRLNDVIKDEKLCSRIVMRTSGALRVILNAHLVSGMRFDMSNEQCLRFTNVDGIYLIKGAPKDIDQLNSAVDYRLREILKRCAKSEADYPSGAIGAGDDDDDQHRDKHRRLGGDSPSSLSPPPSKGSSPPVGGLESTQPMVDDSNDS